jgi:hypothetical protein
LVAVVGHGARPLAAEGWLEMASRTGLRSRAYSSASVVVTTVAVRGDVAEQGDLADVVAGANNGDPAAVDGAPGGAGRSWARFQAVAGQLGAAGLGGQGSSSITRTGRCRPTPS